MGDNVKHTPGPWQIEFGHTQTASGIQYWQVTDGADAICCNQFCYAGDAEANARLIAAAPDLLEAAKDVLKLFRYHTEDAADAADFAAAVEIQIEAAISKAEARP